LGAKILKLDFVKLDFLTPDLPKLAQERHCNTPANVEKWAPVLFRRAGQDSKYAHD
jgi:hypothetical protein